MLDVSKLPFLISLSLTGLDASFLSGGRVTLHFLGKLISRRMHAEELKLKYIELYLALQLLT